MSAPGIGNWLKNFDDPARRDRVWQIGMLTGLRAEKDGSFRPANFERGLVLDRIMELRQPRNILEIGTGRGLGAFVMAAAARAYGVEADITTADIIPPSQAQDYALEVDGERKRLRASCAEMWARHLDPALASRIKPLTGPTAATLPLLLRDGRKFDFIFIDAGHDLFSVAHDLSYAAALVKPDGAILMDDFAPLEEFGLGTCVALTHARRLFAHVEMFASEGLIFGGAVRTDAPRGMVFLAERRGDVTVRRARLPFWRLAGLLLHRCYSRRSFPAQASE
jgi:predicted O-methyltransferase YrrM